MPGLFGKTLAQEAKGRHLAVSMVVPADGGGVEYAGLCSKINLCRWVGPVRKTVDEARADCRAHEAEANSGGGSAPLGESTRPR